EEYPDRVHAGTRAGWVSGPATDHQGLAADHLAAGGRSIDTDGGVGRRGWWWGRLAAGDRNVLCYIHPTAQGVGVHVERLCATRHAAEIGGQAPARVAIGAPVCGVNLGSGDTDGGHPQADATLIGGCTRIGANRVHPTAAGS